MMVLGVEILYIAIGLCCFCFALGATTVVLIYERADNVKKLAQAKQIEVAEVPTIPVMRVQSHSLPRRSYMRTEYRLPCKPEPAGGSDAGTGSGE